MGSGALLPRYPASAHVSALARSPHMLRRIRPVARDRGDTDLLLADAAALPLATGSVDAAVSSLVLCSVPRPAKTLAELASVLRPGGELRLLEHVRTTLVPLPPRNSAWPRPREVGSPTAAASTGTRSGPTATRASRSKSSAASPSACCTSCSGRARHARAHSPRPADRPASGRQACRPKGQVRGDQRATTLGATTAKRRSRTWGRHARRAYASLIRHALAFPPECTRSPR